MQSKPKTVDDYISNFEPEVQTKLKAIREIVLEEAPKASECISYEMPTYKLRGNLVHFGAFKKHIGLYPTPSGISEFAEELATYTAAKGSVQFPLDKDLPLDLIRRIVRFRVAQANDGKGG